MSGAVEGAMGRTRTWSERGLSGGDQSSRAGEEGLRGCAPCEGGAARAGWRLRKMPGKGRRKREK
ncbi:hypothetical protein BD310DRAFT_931601 [Dichomitus squalens]|uniref:Uncharacterized protein n=1 Tax=Dichomitus squalens TaxID=114155 RepID=A0A4Q9PPW9_9APHY|nr:hypothetical protein BD310DRAFT_931601 [Dichomitus squalens]